MKCSVRIQIFSGLSLSLALLGVITTVTAANVRLVQPLPGVKCIAKYEDGKLACDDGNCDLSDPNHVFKLACETDCKEQHGASFGFCLGDVCECGPLDPTVMARKLQCLDTTYAELFQSICEDDCKCTHDRVGGLCNFETKACECGPLNLKPTLDCPVSNANEYIIKLVGRYASIGYNIVEIFTSGSL